MTGSEYVTASVCFPRVYFPRPYRTARRPPGGLLADLLARDPHCRACGLDLLALAERRFRLSEAIYGALDALYGDAEGVFAPPAVATWAGRYCERPGAAALRAMGFPRPLAPLVELDHIVPIWAGGSDRAENSQPLCQPCHRAKTAREAGQRAALRRRAVRKGLAPRTRRSSGGVSTERDP